jgi:phage replication-related protein YjqB (UPF0714/DUF867 family)
MGTTGKMDRYESFYVLREHEQEGVAYSIYFRTGTSGVAVMAPHGGGIEPGTTDVADSVAGADHAFYSFCGTRKAGNGDLHVASERFDEPTGVRISEGSDVVLSIHGCSDAEEVIFVGGKDLKLRKILSDTLIRTGFVATAAPRPSLNGINAKNICNRGKSGEGVQIELSQGIRRKIFESMGNEQSLEKKKLFFDLVAALRQAISEYMPELNRIHSLDPLAA